MEPISYAPPAGKPIRPKRFFIFCCTVLAVALTAIAILAISIWQSRAPSPANPGPIGLRPAPEPLGVAKFDSDAVFDERVRPVLKQLQDRDMESVRQAIARIHGHFDTARNGAPAFAAAIIGPLNSVKTTYLAGKGAVERWWYDDPQIQPVADHVRWNYERDVTSVPEIKDAILASVGQLEQDFRANRNEALQAIRSSLRAASLPDSVEIDAKQLDEFCQGQFDAAMLAVNTDHVAEKGAAGSAAALAINSAVSIIVERAIIYYALDDAVVAAGGSVATGTTGGAAVGSWVPGPGTAIGAVAGLLAGCAVDVWISSKDKERTTKQVITSLNQIEDGIINGDGKHPGVQAILNDAASIQVHQLGDKLQEQLKEAAR